MSTVAEKRRAFRALFAGGCFVIPNPWDIGFARCLQHLDVRPAASSGAARSAGKLNTFFRGDFAERS